MPPKFALFKVFNIASLLILLFVAIKIGSTITEVSFRFTRDDWTPIVILLLAFTSYAGTSFWSLRFCRKYRLQEDINPIEKNSAIVFFFSQAIFQFLILLYFPEQLKNIWEYVQVHLQNGSYTNAAILVSPMPLFFLTLYCQVLFFPFMKEIHNQFFANQLNDLGKTDTAS